jgi:predicted metalloprotease with PDZ domain
MRQTVEEASFDAWIKFYRPDENSPNVQVSYYLKGSLIGLSLDLMIRNRTRGRKSLDDVMRALWEHYGRSGLGIPEDGIEKLAAQVAGASLRTFFDRALRSTDELPLKQVLATVGIAMQLRSAQSPADAGGKAVTGGPSAVSRRVSLGVRATEDPAGARLTHVLDAGAAQAAGLSAGDVVVAVDGLKVSAKNLDQRLARYQPGNSVTLHAFRRDELLVVEVKLRASPLDTCALAVAAPERTAANRRRAWLQGKS